MHNTTHDYVNFKTTGAICDGMTSKSGAIYAGMTVQQTGAICAGMTARLKNENPQTIVSLSFPQVEPFARKGGAIYSGIIT